MRIRPIVIGPILLLALLVLAGIAWLCRQPASLSSAPSSPPGKQLGRQEAARKVGENHWVVAQWARQDYMADLARVTREAILKPAMGEARGSVRWLTVSHLTPESPLEMAGFKIDDRLLVVNGTPVETLTRAVNLVNEIRSAPTVTVKAQRGDRVIDFRFDFEP